MHGRSRISVKAESESESDPRQKAAKQNKVSLYTRLQKDVLHFHKEKQYTAEALQQCARLLELNPDVYTAWNFRKAAVCHLLAEAGEDKSARKKVAEEELRLVEKALRKNPKSYGAWHHRKWIVAQGLANIKREFDLIASLLGLDNRNFHGWDYRRFVVEYAGVKAAEELQYSLDKINEEPRNYSAWHSRSQLLTAVHRVSAGSGESPSSGLGPTSLRAEYELVRHALWTAPEDQSGFMYYQWLLGQTVPQEKPSLVATWPAVGTTVARTEGLVLGFSRPVKGVGGETVGVRVQAETRGEADRVQGLSGRATEVGPMGGDWRPVGGSGGASQTWVKEVEGRPREGTSAGGDSEGTAGSIMLDVGCSQGIESLSGVPLARPVQIGFTMSAEQRPGNALDLASGGLSRPDWPSEGEGGAAQMQPAQGEDALPPEAGRLAPPPQPSEEATLDGDSWRGEILRDEIEMCRELLSEETESTKWPKLTLARLLAAEQACGGRFHETEIVEVYGHLAREDAPHEEYYKDQLGRLKLRQVLRTRGSLKSHWWSPPGTSASESEASASGAPLGGPGWLRLSHMELGPLEGMHGLLWVRQLDLSHNSLRSAHGLECLQLLVRLDLSHNRIAHSTALLPLVLLPRLRALNLSHNLIGAIANDMLRYSSPMPSSHWTPWIGTVESTRADDLPAAHKDNGKTGEGEEDGEDGERLRKLLGSFQGLKLASLDMAGNEVVHVPGFRDFAKRAIPSLRLLDGVAVP